MINLLHLGWFAALTLLRGVAASCPPDVTITEVEPNCGLPFDTTNGGCTAFPGRFIETVSGDVICGTLAKAGTSGDSDWYRMHLPTPAVVTCELSGEGACFVALMSNGGSPRCDPAPSPIDFQYAKPGETITLTMDSVREGSHFIVVGSSLDDMACGTPYVLRWNAESIPPPLNEECGQAVRIGALPARLPGYTLGAQSEAGLPECPDPPAAPGVWYVVRGNGNNYVVNSCGANEISYNHRINVYKGACGALECVPVDIHAAVCAAYVYTPEARWCTEPGVDYYILWNGEAGRTGRFDINIWDDGPSNCEPLAACCVGDACLVMTRPSCAVAGGIFIRNAPNCARVHENAMDRVYSNDEPVSAVDGVCPEGAVSDIVVTDDFAVANLRVRVRLSRDAELAVVSLRLVRDGRVVLLHRYACPDVFSMDVQFDDVAAIPDCETAQGGLWRPLSPLATLAGGSSQGIWSLQLCDADAFFQTTIEGWQLTLTPGLLECPECTGDANGDRVVDGADLAVLLESFGRVNVEARHADFNHDGVIDAADLSVLLSAFGSDC